jgi:hypothetical protein
MIKLTIRLKPAHLRKITRLHKRMFPLYNARRGKARVIRMLITTA